MRTCTSGAKANTFLVALIKTEFAGGTGPGPLRPPGVGDYPGGLFFKKV